MELLLIYHEKLFCAIIYSYDTNSRDSYHSKVHKFHQELEIFSCAPCARFYTVYSIIT